MEKRAAIVVGATGLTGRQLVEKLCESEEYVSVTVIARRKLTYTHPKLDMKIRSFDTLEEQDVEIAHDLYCCLGTTRKKACSKEAFEQVDLEYPLNIASIAKKRGVQHMLVISAMGASPKSMFYYSRIKGTMEQELIKLKLPRLSIFRPSLLTGKREEYRLGERIGEQILKVLSPLLIGPLKRYQSIEAAQVAEGMLISALYGKKRPVSIYSSHEIAALKRPEEKEEPPIPREQLFNWEKRQDIFVETDEEQRQPRE